MKQLKYKIGEKLWLTEKTGKYTGPCTVVRYQTGTAPPYVVEPENGGIEVYGAKESQLSYPTKLGKLLAGVEDV
jgi:hypothetical protein